VIILLVENIFKGVSSWSVFNATGGPKLVEMFVLVIVVGVMLALVSRWIPKFLIRPIVVICVFGIIYFVVKTA
jgi:hypothetical protein